jgi:choline dehydrogenase-like flavoprotein
MRPTSVGFVGLQSKDPRAPPLLEPNYLSTEQDRTDIRTGVRLTHEILAQKAFDPFRGRFLEPASATLSDDALDAWIRAHTESAFVCHMPFLFCGEKTAKPIGLFPLAGITRAARPKWGGRTIPWP